jgi:hypothetical protein
VFTDTSIQDWWLWDGRREWRVGALSPEQQDLPERGIWNDTALMHEIERRSGKAFDAPSTPEPAELQRNVQHYLYHKSKSPAARLAAAVRRLGLECELCPSGDTESWLVLVRQAPTTSANDISAASAALKQLAESFNGEYDGLEIPAVGSGDPNSLHP